MKLFKHFVLAAALLCGLLASAQESVQTISPYSVDFETTVSTSDNFAVAKGWGRTGTSSIFSYRTGQGVDGSTAFYCGYQSTSSPNYLVTTRLTGTASVMVKNYNDKTVVKFYKATKSEAGEYVIGEEITSTITGEPSTTAYCTYSISGLNNEMVAIYGHYAYLDNFAATSAEVDLYKSLKVVSCKLASSSSPDCDAEGNFQVALTGKITNDGDLPFNPGDEGFSYSIGKYNSSTTPHVILGTKTFEKALAVGDTADVEISVKLNVADYATRSRYDLVENYSHTSAYGSWIEPVKYEPKLVLRDEKSYNMGTDDNTAKKFGTFGMISVNTEKKFTVENAGAAPMTANITVPEGFAVSVATVNVAAHEKKEVTLTALATTPGIFSGNLSVEVVGYNTIDIPLSSTVLDTNKFFENFEADKNSKAVPIGWFDCGKGNYWTKTDYTNGANNFMKNGSSSNPSILATPKLKVEEGEKMTFDAARNSAYGTSTVDVYYSADRKNWTPVLASENINLKGTNAGTSSTQAQTWANFVVEGVPVGEYYIGFESGYASIDNVYGFKKVDVAHDVVATETNMPAIATVNDEYVATLKARNIHTATEAAEAYTATLYFGDDAVATSETSEIASAGEANFKFAFTPHAAGTYSAYMKLTWADGYEMVTDTAQVVVGEEKATSAVVVGVGNGTATSPLFLNYKNSVSETLYTAEMLAAVGLKAGDKIGSLTYQGYNTAGDVTTNVKAFVMNCTDTEYGAADYTADADMTKVFDGEYTFKKQGKSTELVDMMVITFAEPFVYNGGAIRVQLQSESTKYKNVYFATDGTLAKMCYGNKHDSKKVSDLTQLAASEWKFPVTNFGVILDPAVLKGKVVDESNAPLEGVSIELIALPDPGIDGAEVHVPDVRYYGETGAEGLFEIPVIKADRNYLAIFFKPGYITAAKTITAITEIPDVVLEKEVPTAVTDVVDSKAVDSNVYTIDGRIVRTNATSLEGLDKGIYIFQGKKHIVR